MSGATRRAVLNLNDVRPVWAPDRATVDAIVAVFPPGWMVRVIDTPADGRGDGGGVAEEVVAAVAGAEVYIGFGVPAPVLRAAGATLRWAHTGTAGVGSLLYDEMRASDVVLTNSAGVHAAPIAETVFAMALHFARGLDHAVRAQASARWDPAPFERAADGSIFELAGLTLGILGLGGIGLEVAHRARAFGMRVLATRRSDAPAPDGIELVRADDAVARLLADSDIVAVCLPSTAQTRSLLDRAALARLRRNAVLINVSRGDVVDEDALIDLLRTGRIRGAGLDVFRREPLPAESPLWTLPNALIMPHVSGTTTRFWQREQALIIDNIGRYLAGRPLRNVVDKRAGY